MKVIVLGSGINGVLSAYFLARAGCEVTVLEKEAQSAAGCSGSNGGQLSFSHCEPWSSKASLMSFLKAAISPNSFLSIPELPNKEFFIWALEFFKNSRPSKSIKIAKKNLKLGNFSKQVLNEILSKEKIDFCYKNEGTLHFYRDEKIFNKAIIEAKTQKSLGSNIEILSAEECVKKEPTLTKILDEKVLRGGIFFKDDASGDCSSFIKGLESICKNKLGVKFHYNCEVKNLLTNGKKITGINTPEGVFVGNAYLDCLGAFGNSLLKGIKIDPKIYPVKGYSLSIPTDELFLAPNMALTDPANKIVYSRLGNVFRAAGTVEICNLKNEFNQKNINFLKNVVRDTYSDFGDLKNAKEWSGFRPYRPECLPLVCKSTKYGNLFLNIGHGSLGWTMSFATSRIISNIILQQDSGEDFSFLEEAEKKMYLK
ncbi:MAG: D-amino-acid dehydrogenase [Rickettsiales bacterium]|jgi:D-amino-acid dehydrogenase